MKKLIVIIGLISILTSTGAQIAEGLISKLLAFSVKELLVERVFGEMWKSAICYESEVSGHSLYYTARSISYENLGIDYKDHQVYIQGRTLVVARIKNYFFDGSRLKETYLAIQPKFKEEFEKLPEDQKHSLRRNLSVINVSFQFMLRKENQEKYKKWLENYSPVSNSDLAEIWLENNLPAEEIAKRINAGELKETPDRWDLEGQAFEAFPDKDIAKFAGRRLKEGGEELLKKYLEVINLAIEDTRL